MTANVFASGAARDQLLLHTDTGADRGTACPHLEVLPGKAKVQSGFGRVPSYSSQKDSVNRLGGDLSLDLLLTAQCHNYTNAFTP